MLDKRCHYKVRELSKFYLFVKHKKIYYAYFPEYNITKSTGATTLKGAYQKAWEIYPTLTSQNIILFKPFENKKTQKDLKRALSFINQNNPLTSHAISTAQKKMLKEGLSGKSINNYIYLLKRSYQGDFPKWNPVEHAATYRKCFPVKPFYGFWNKCTTRLHYLAFFAMTTGCRAGEIYSCEKITDWDGRLYLKINGTKTKNAVRTIPVLQQTLDCMEYLQSGFRTSAYKESVVEAGRLCGFDEAYIEENHIVFHSFRKMYKTLLESCGVPNTFIEYFMGHSQTSKVNQLYFIGSSADDTEVYPKVIEALGRFL